MTGRRGQDSNPAPGRAASASRPAVPAVSAAGWLAGDDALLEIACRAATQALRSPGGLVAPEEARRLLAACTLARARPPRLVFRPAASPGCFDLDGGQLWDPGRSLLHAFRLQLLARCPNKWLPLDAAATQKAVASAFGRTLDSLQRVDWHLAEALRLARGRLPGVHLRTCRRGMVWGRLTLTARSPAIETSPAMSAAGPTLLTVA